MASIITYFREDHGWDRLLEQPGDIVPRDEKRKGRGMSGVRQEWRDLFADYCGDLGTALSIAGPWWSETILARERTGLSREQAIKESFNKRAAGAASHPKVIWIVRTYWENCEALNRDLSGQDRVYPEDFLLRWLREAGHDELVRLVTCMPYWPIGLDADGNWC